MIRVFARFKALDIELSLITVGVDYLPNKIGVRAQLLEQIEIYYSGVKREPKSINICGYDSSYSIAWIEFSEREGADLPMSRFVRDFNYKRFLGNVLTVSVLLRCHVVSGLPSVVPDGRTLGSKQIRQIARGEHLCFTCLKPGHTRAECPTYSRF